MKLFNASINGNTCRKSWPLLKASLHKKKIKNFERGYYKLRDLKKIKLSKEKSICVIQFSGKKSDWDSWMEKFLAKAELRGWLGTIGTNSKQD